MIWNHFLIEKQTKKKNNINLILFHQLVLDLNILHSFDSSCFSH